ncbi:MAG: sulfatase-like hydrolase/transferase, partial [Rikenellaceae bacterium]
AELLKEIGYTTACIGKWHLGHKPENMPLANGFDYFFGSPFSNDMSRKEQAKVGKNNYPHEYVIYEQDKIIETEPDQTDLTNKINEKAISFIEENKKKPFFLYLTHPMPHWPVYASEEFQGTSARGPYGDCIEELDASVGDIIETLKKNGLEDNTLVVFTSDNGPWLTYKSMGGSAGHLNEGKAAVLDGGFRVPCIMWGSMVKPAHITDMGSTLDLLPTICELTGAELPSDRVYDGSSLMGVLKRVETSPRENFFYYRNGFLYALRKGDYKILFAYQSGYGGEPRVVYDTPKLFNIAQDPEERYNIADENPALVEELTIYAQKHKNEIEIKPALFDAVDY